MKCRLIAVVKPQAFSCIFYTEMIFPVEVLPVQDVKKLRRHTLPIVLHFYDEAVLFP